MLLHVEKKLVLHFQVPVDLLSQQFLLFGQVKSNQKKLTAVP